MKIIAANNPNDEDRKQSSSGGVFTQIAERVLSEGGVVYGVAFDDQWLPKHIRVDNIYDLAKLKGSKYVFSDYLDSVERVRQDLDLGKFVLFSGTPCQVAVMRKRVGVNERLLLVELVCHGAPEVRFWSLYIDALCKKFNRSRSEIKTINFRDKITGWKDYSFTIQFNNGQTFTQRASENLYMRAFLQDLTLRRSCFKCSFKHPNGSKADITLGDFWGIEKVFPEIDNNEGTSIVIGNTSLGLEMISHIAVLKELRLVDIIQYNPAICKSASMPFQYERFNIESRSYSDILALFHKYAGIRGIDRLRRFIKRTVMHFKQ